jgi:hypothetical protein
LCIALGGRAGQKESCEPTAFAQQNAKKAHSEQKKEAETDELIIVE